MDAVLNFLSSAAKLMLAVGLAYIAALWFALIVWTYRDIEQRSRSVITQIFATLLVVLFFVPGALLYFVLRPRDTLDESFQRSLEEEYLLQDLEDLPRCHHCHRAIESDWIVCPACHTELRHECPNCTHLVRVTWDICPYCATELEPAAVPEEESGSIGRLISIVKERIGKDPTLDGKPGEPVYAHPGQEMIVQSGPQPIPFAPYQPPQQVQPAPPTRPFLLSPNPPQNGNGSPSYRPPGQPPAQQQASVLPAQPKADPYEADMPVDFGELPHEMPQHRVVANGHGPNGNGANGNGMNSNGNGAYANGANGNGMNGHAPNGNGNGYAPAPLPHREGEPDPNRRPEPVEQPPRRS